MIKKFRMFSEQVKMLKYAEIMPETIFQLIL